MSLARRYEHLLPKVYNHTATPAELQKVSQVRKFYLKKNPVFPMVKRKRIGPATAIMYQRQANARTGGFMGMEIKFVDYDYNATCSTTWAGAEADPATPSCLNGISQGDGESNRDGRGCTLTSVHIRGRLVLPKDQDEAAAGKDCQLARIVVVQDKQTNGAQLNAEDVMVDGTNPVHTFRNLANSSRFNVLWDETFELHYQSASHDGTNIDYDGVCIPFKWNRKLSVPVLHNGTGGTVSTITNNSIHVIAVSTSAAVSLVYESRVRFKG